MAESRLDRIERTLEETSREWDRRNREAIDRHREAMAELEVQRVNIESLHAGASELNASGQRHEREIELLLAASRQDGENIRALARLAEAHQRRIEDLE